MAPLLQNIYRGHIIDYFGDGLLAVFEGEDVAAAGCCISAVQASLQMQQSMQVINQVISKVYHKYLSIRIGIHYGKVIVGRVGKENMQKIAVVGDNVNLASRIERINKELQTTMLVSECAFKHIHEYYQATRHYVVNVQGKSGVYKLFEIQPLTITRDEVSNTIQS